MVTPMTPDAASQVVVRDREPIDVSAAYRAAAGSTPRTSWQTFPGTRVPAASLTQRMALALTTPTKDIRGVDVYGVDVSGSRKGSPPV
jgi:hypothetical protein